MRRRFFRRSPFVIGLVGLVSILAVAAVCPAQTTRPAASRRGEMPDPRAGYDWEQDARARKLDDATIDRLRRDKLVVTHDAFRQSYRAYQHAGMPVFITSDSLLNGFNVLFEESVQRMEHANVRPLREILRATWTNLATVDANVRGDPALTAAAKRRAQVVVGTALKLLGEETLRPDAPAATAALIDAEVTKVSAAAAVADRPAWLGPADPGSVAIDYGRFRPRGFYTRSPSLQRYFRAVAWLQAIPFRIGRDEELLSVLMLGSAMSPERINDWDERQAYEAFFDRYAAFLGVQDDPDVPTVTRYFAKDLDVDLAGGAGDLARRRERLSREFNDRAKGRPQINDQVAVAPSEPAAAWPSVRVLAAYRTPDAVLMQRTTDPRVFGERWPSGLEVAAALGSDFARAELTRRDGPRADALLTRIEDARPLFGLTERPSKVSLYQQYMGCLAALLNAPEPDAPPLFGGEPWRVKSCAAALGGWVQTRHTWVLQAKAPVMFGAAGRRPAGFVEPDPEFFARTAALAERAEALLEQAGAFDFDPAAAAADARAAADVIEKRDLTRLTGARVDGFTADEWTEVRSIGDLVQHLSDGAYVDPAFAFNDSLEASLRGAYAAALPKLKQLAADLEAGKPLDPETAKVVRGSRTDLRPLWRDLARVARRLESLAHKQLRGAEWTDDEKAFLLGYGNRLGLIMLHQHALDHPRDDAPRAVDVFNDPWQGKHLIAATARPRRLYLLYPYRGGDVLCTGVVLPYHEFAHARRLTDAEWKAMLDSPQAPPLPAWEQSIYAPPPPPPATQGAE